MNVLYSLRLENWNGRVGLGFKICYEGLGVKPKCEIFFVVVEKHQESPLLAKN